MTVVSRMDLKRHRLIFTSMPTCLVDHLSHVLVQRGWLSRGWHGRKLKPKLTPSFVSFSSTTWKRAVVCKQRYSPSVQQQQPAVVLLPRRRLFRCWPIKNIRHRTREPFSHYKPTSAHIVTYPWINRPSSSWNNISRKAPICGIKRSLPASRAGKLTVPQRFS